MNDILIIGCGYVGMRLARQYLERPELGRGRRVLGLVQSEAGRARLAAAGIPGLCADLATADLDALPLAGAAIFHLAPPPGEGREDPGTRRLAAALARADRPPRVVYISTTGVYGDCEGAWVDESWPARPGADRAHRRWDAEESLRAWSTASGGELVILRVAGIYGPGRLPLARIRQGVPMVRAEDSPYSNRIHVDDLVGACVLAMERGVPGSVYNACDDRPSTMTDYFLAVADAAGLPRPPLIPLAEAGGQVSAAMLSYLAESRRLCNRRLREDLGLELRYPSLAEGLPACLAPDLEPGKRLTDTEAASAQ